MESEEKTNQKMDAQEIAKESAKVFSERLEKYGKSYKKNGDVMSAMFPEGLFLKTPNDFARFAAMNWIIGKLNRYANQFENGGHADSAIDLINYSAILAELTLENENE